MSQDTSQTKTEQATPRRREEARKKGQVPYSPDLSSSFMLFIVFTAMWFLSPPIGSMLVRMMRLELLSASDQISVWHSGEIKNVFVGLLGNSLAASGVLASLAFGASLLIGVSQAGVQLSFQAMSPNWERLNLASGWSRLISMRSSMKAGMALAKAMVAAAAAWWVLQGAARQCSTDMTLLQAISITWYAALKLALLVNGIMLPLAIVDYLFQRQKHESDLRMTRQEVVEEQRDQEVDPHLRARFRRIQRETMQKQSLEAVPNATVVLANPTHFAVALRYERGETEAPVIVAKGHDEFAQEIMKIARKHGVPVIRRPPVARALYALGEVGQSIPEALFNAVAEVLAFVYANRRGQL